MKFCFSTNIYLNMTRDLCCLRLATAAFDINVEPLKENGIPLSQFAQNIVEVSF